MRGNTLTHKEEAFAQNFCDGLSKSESWRRAYKKPDAQDRTASKNGYMVCKRPWVQERIAELKKVLDDERALSRVEKRMMLADVARRKKMSADEARAHSVRMKAIEQDNIMTGDNAPQKVEVFGMSEMLAMVRKQTPPQ